MGSTPRIPSLKHSKFAQIFKPAYSCFQLLKRLSEAEARTHLTPHAERFSEPDPLFGAEVDLKVMVHKGAALLPPGTYDNLSLIHI